MFPGKSAQRGVFRSLNPLNRGLHRTRESETRRVVQVRVWFYVQRLRARVGPRGLTGSPVDQ